MAPLLPILLDRKPSGTLLLATQKFPPLVPAVSPVTGPYIYDRVKETTTTTGTSDLVLLGAVTDFQSFAIVGNGNTCFYCCEDGASWEVGLGTYSTTGPTLARTTILAS